MTPFYTRVDSPLGPLLIVFNGTALTGLYFTGHGPVPGISQDWVACGGEPPLADAKRQLEDYFAGRMTRFDLPLAPAGTSFQRRVWDELRRIPYGRTVSYGEIARRIGAPGASRAVGLANSRNPIAIVVPCHRVIGGDGSLTGYAGGLDRKRALLAFEASVRLGGPHAMPERESGSQSSHGALRLFPLDG